MLEKCGAQYIAVCENQGSNAKSIKHSTEHCKSIKMLFFRKKIIGWHKKDKKID